jgi:uncharacterized protein involved in exopolysaccharide biosynthesis
VTAATIVAAGKIDGPREETSLLAFFSILLAHRRMIALCALLGTMIFAAFAWSKTEKYESRASFIVKGAATPVQIPNSATSLGLALTAYADFQQSVVFYSDLAAANVILRSAAQELYATSTSKGARRPLADVLGIKYKSPKDGIEKAAHYLARNVSSAISARSGIVAISVASPDPLLSQEIATKILYEIGMWSRANAHAQAVREREFTEGVANDAHAKLSQAEQALASFRTTNRDINAPDLKLEDDRLFREVQMRQEIYTAVAGSLEQAKIEEGRDRMAINIVEVASLPAEPMTMAAWRRTFFGLATGLLVGMVLAFLKQRAYERRVLSV